MTYCGADVRFWHLAVVALQMSAFGGKPDIGLCGDGSCPAEWVRWFQR